MDPPDTVARGLLPSIAENDPIQSTNTTWDTLLTADDMKKIDTLSMKRRKDFIASAIRMASQLDPTAAIEYARSLLEQRILSQRDDISDSSSFVSFVLSVVNTSNGTGIIVSRVQPTATIPTHPSRICRNARRTVPVVVTVSIPDRHVV